MRIELAARAKRDLVAISAYLAQHNPTAAARVGDAIERTIRRLEIFPMAGRRQEGVDGVRKLVVPTFGYLIYYRSEGERISILTIRHGARKRIFVDR